jgi:hypothetical protein
MNLRLVVPLAAVVGEGGGGVGVGRAFGDSGIRVPSIASRVCFLVFTPILQVPMYHELPLAQGCVLVLNYHVVPSIRYLLAGLGLKFFYFSRTLGLTILN